MGRIRLNSITPANRHERRASNAVGKSPLWTREQTAKVLNCHVDTVSDLIAKGELDAVRLGDSPSCHLRVIPESVDALIERRRIRPAVV
jgi:excisionase family DNA binding protein